MMGSSVNLAARLMGGCPLGSIIVDERVRAAACEHLAFVDMGTILAKGYADPVPVFAFQDAANDVDDEDGLKSENIGDKVVIGRKEQLITLRLAVEDFAQGVKGFERQFHFLEGEEGIGDLVNTTTYITACLPACLPARLPACLPACLPVRCAIMCIHALDIVRANSTCLHPFRQIPRC
jgi:hypothetical protein